YGLAVDGAGNVFVGDYYSRRVRKISANQVVTTIAGSGAFGYADGLGTQAIFKTPAGIAIDSMGNIYVSDRENGSIRKLTPKGCTIPAKPTISGVPTICSGNSTVLTSSALYGNIWSTGDTTRSITVSTAGDYSVQAYSDVCTSAISEVVTVSLAEIVFTNTATSSANNICIGTSVELNTNRLLGTVLNQTNSTAYNISEVGTSTIQSVINVPNSYNLLSEDTVLVKLNINHTYLGDLSITLVSPTGTRVLLFENHGSNSDNLTNTVFSNFYSGATLSSGSAPYTGVFVPEGPLFYFVNSNVAGNWTLEVTDRYNSDGGTLINWSFEVRTRGKFKGFRWSVLDGAQLDSASTMSVTPTTTTSYVVNKTFLTGCIDQDTVTVTVLPNGGWKGITTDWNTASNWCGGVPTNATEVSLPSSGIMPIITGTTATCGNLTIPEAITLNISNGGNLSLQGNISGLGKIEGVSGSSLTLNGSTNQTIQKVNVGNLVVNNTAGISLGSDIFIKSGITLTNGVLNTNTHTLELSADCFSLSETDNSYVAGTILTHSYPVGSTNLEKIGVNISRGSDDLDTIMIIRTDEKAIFNGREGIGHIWKIRTGVQPINGRPVTFNWKPRADNGKNLSALQLYRRSDSGGEWIRMGSVTDGSARNLGVSTTSFSDWTVSDEDAPLPVTLTSFTGKATCDDGIDNILRQKLGQGVVQV
ncbi:MAG: proprotein convertase P-domain-containing protein, partial [Flexibacteraceae bacterium]